jgi:hypothetical protein
MSRSRLINAGLLLRILLIGYLYGITSERKLVEELRMHLAWRWFTGVGFDQEIPHHSTFSKNRHGRFQESKLFEELFKQIVRQCIEVGLVQGKQLSVDGSFVEANASKESRIPREQLAEAAQVDQTVRQYLLEVEEQNPREEPVHQQDQVSTTDPDSTYATKGGTLASLGYYDNYLVDNDSWVIVGVEATAARMSQETVAAQNMLTRFAEWQGRAPESVAADTTYGNGELLQWLADRSITPYMRTRDSIRGKSNEPLQSLADCEWLGMETPYRGSDWFRAADMNFDGYADIFVLTSWGATGNETGCVWLFDPKSGRFEFSREFSELGTYTLDPATKTITTRGHAGADTIEAAKYMVENNRPVLVITVSQYFDSDKQEYHCVGQQRGGRQNELLTKRDLWAKSLEDACDPTDPFGRGVTNRAARSPFSGCKGDTEQLLRKVNCAASSESRNRLTDVALFMNSFSLLIRLAGF